MYTLANNIRIFFIILGIFIILICFLWKPINYFMNFNDEAEIIRETIYPYSIDCRNGTLLRSIGEGYIVIYGEKIDSLFHNEKNLILFSKNFKGILNQEQSTIVLDSTISNTLLLEGNYIKMDLDKHCRIDAD